MNEKLNNKVRRLEEEILENHRTDKDLFKRLNQAQQDLKILDDGRPFCPFLRPHFFMFEQYKKIAHAAEVLADAFERMTYAALENDEILSELDLTETEKQMALINPRYPVICNSSRLDTFLYGNDFKFLEYNAETPAGITDQMQIEKVLMMIPEVAEFLDKNPHWKPKPHEKLLEGLVTSYHKTGGKKEKPNIAIVDWKDVATVAEFEVLQEYFVSEGFETIIADPYELEYDGEALRVGEFVIDIFYKRVLIHEYLEKFDETSALVRAYADGKVCMANSFRTKIPHKKSSFAVVSDDRFSEIFTDEQLEMIRKHIPWTRRVRDRNVKYNGENHELLELLRREKDKFLIKPNDDYGGHGIFLGWETEQSVWETALNNAIENSFIAQERVAVEKVTIPAHDGEEITMTELLIDFDPFLFRGKVEGGLVRLSASSLVNVAQGGGETALVVLENG
jgi:hypothetical protein